MGEERGHYVHAGYHRWMLEDEPRMDALTRAISALVRPGDVVADVGTGTGILAVLAKRAGARQVYGVDASPIARLARRMVERNQLDGITILEADCATLRLPEPVDVVLSECLGNLAFGDRMFKKVAAFADHNLKPGGRVSPGSISMWLQPCDCRLFGDPRPFWKKPYRGLDLTAFLPAVESQIEIVEVVASFCHGEPAHAVTFDPMARADSYRLEGEWGLPAGKVNNGVLCWFDVDWAPGVTLSTGPRAPMTHWAQALFRIPERAVLPGDRLRFVLDVVFDDEETPKYSWSGGYVDGAGASCSVFTRRADDPFAEGGGFEG